jgi:hypothetical protein
VPNPFRSDRLAGVGLAGGGVNRAHPHVIGDLEIADARFGQGAGGNAENAPPADRQARRKRRQVVLAHVQAVSVGGQYGLGAVVDNQRHAEWFQTRLERAGECHQMRQGRALLAQLHQASAAARGRTRNLFQIRAGLQVGRSRHEIQGRVEPASGLKTAGADPCVSVSGAHWMRAPVSRVSSSIL